MDNAHTDYRLLRKQHLSAEPAQLWCAVDCNPIIGALCTAQIRSASTGTLDNGSLYYDRVVMKLWFVRADR